MTDGTPGRSGGIKCLINRVGGPTCLGKKRVRCVGDLAGCFVRGRTLLLHTKVIMGEHPPGRKTKKPGPYLGALERARQSVRAELGSLEVGEALTAFYRRRRDSYLGEGREQGNRRRTSSGKQYASSTRSGSGTKSK